MNNKKIELQFTERMAGHGTRVQNELLLNLNKNQFYDYEQSDKKNPIEFTLTIDVNDVQKFADDPNLLAKAMGTVKLNNSSDMKVEKGEFNLFLRPEASNSLDTEKEMHYTLYFRDAQNEPYTFFGYKTLTKENGLNAWQETTTLYFYIWRGHSAFNNKEKKNVDTIGVLHISPLDFIHQMTTFKTTPAEIDDTVFALTTFFGEFAKNLWEAYAPFVFTTTTSRWREHLVPLHTTMGVHKGTKELIPFNTDDGISLSLQRFTVKKSKNVVLLLHGLTTSTDMFIMPEHYNLVNYLHDHGFDDIWSLDWRGSERHTYNLMPHRYTMDDIAKYDLPNAVELIRSRVSSDTKIHIICHCVGSIGAMCSLASGQTQGISSVISNSVSLTPKVKWQSKLKVLLGPDILEHLFGYPYISPRMPYFPGPLFGKWIYWMERLLRHECKEPSCHMVSFMWGWGFPAAYEHENLHPVTHRRLHDLFGGTSFHYYRHIRKMVKNEEAVPYTQEGEYANLPESYLKNISKVKLPPLLLIAGGKNNIFPGSNKLTQLKIKELSPNTESTYLEFANYGHQDTLMGNNVHIDVFPHLIQFLRRYS